MTLHHIFVLEKSGLPVQSLCIDHNPTACSLGKMDESLTAGFLSAIQSFGEQIGAESIREVKSEHFNLIFGLANDAIVIFEVSASETAKQFEYILQENISFLNLAYYVSMATDERKKEQFIGRYMDFLDKFEVTRFQEGDYPSEKAGRFRRFISRIKEKLHLG